MTGAQDHTSAYELERLLTALDGQAVDELFAQLSTMTLPFLPIHHEVVERQRAQIRLGTDQLHFAFRIVGPLDPLRVLAAQRILVERHDALRLVAAHGMDSFVLHADGDWPLARGTVSDVDQETAERLLRDARAAPLALLPGASLARSTLHRMDAEHHILVWSFSHAVVDGWSLGTLWDDFVVAYRGGSESPAAGSYADFLGRQRVVEPPPSAAHLEAQAAPGTLEVRIDESARARIEEHCRRVDTTPYLVLLDCLLRAIEECEIVSPDVRVWSPHAGRDSVDDAAAVGMFVRVVDVGGLGALVRAADHEGAHARTVLARLLQPAAGAWSPMPEDGVLFVLQNAPGGAEALPDCTVDVMRDRSQPEMAPVFEFYARSGSRFLLSLTLGYRGTGLVGLLEYDGRRLTAAAVDEVVAAFQRRLAAIS